VPAAPESAPGMSRRVVALVKGDVQGVGYRWFVRGLASSSGLSGSATNLPDGRVEVVVEGPDDAVAALLDALDGPRAPGTVTGVESRDETVRGMRGFTTA